MKSPTPRLSPQIPVTELPPSCSVTNGPWQGSRAEDVAGSALSPEATHRGFSGSDPPVTRSVAVSEPGAIRRHSGSVYVGADLSAASPGACSPISSPIHATVLPSALIEAPGHSPVSGIAGNSNRSPG